MSEMPLWMGDKGEQAQGLPQVQDPVGYKKIKEGLNRILLDYRRSAWEI
jgi:hypothetical protein